MKNIFPGALMLFLCLSLPVAAQSNLLSAYISDSPSSSVPAWIAKEAGLFKKYGLDIDLVFIDGSTRGIQTLLAGDLSFTEAVGTSAINAAPPAAISLSLMGWSTHCLTTSSAKRTSNHVKT